jgi:hypothetical protein
MYKLFYQRPHYLVNRFAQRAPVQSQQPKRKILPDPTNARSGKNPVIWVASSTCRTERLFTLSLPAQHPLCQETRGRPHVALSLGPKRDLWHRALEPQARPGSDPLGHRDDKALHPPSLSRAVARSTRGTLLHLDLGRPLGPGSALLLDIRYSLINQRLDRL